MVYLKFSSLLGNLGAGQAPSFLWVVLSLFGIYLYSCLAVSNIIAGIYPAPKFYPGTTLFRYTPELFKRCNTTSKNNLGAGLLLLVRIRFQDLFHSPLRGSFRLSLTVLVHYRSIRSI